MWFFVNDVFMVLHLTIMFNEYGISNAKFFKIIEK